MFDCYFCKNLFKNITESQNTDYSKGEEYLDWKFWFGLYGFVYVYNDSVPEGLYKRSVGLATDNAFFVAETLTKFNINSELADRTGFILFQSKILKYVCRQCIGSLVESPAKSRCRSRILKIKY